MKRAVASLCALLMVAALTTPRMCDAAEMSAAKRAATQPTTETSPGVYHSPKYGFTLTVPVDWTRNLAMERAPIVLALEKPNPAPGVAATMVLVQYRPVIRAKVADVAKSMGVAAKESDPQAEASPVSNAVLGGAPGSQIAVLAKIKGVSTRIVYVLAVKDKHLYILSLMNDPAAPPLSDTIVKSFQFTD